MVSIFRKQLLIFANFFKINQGGKIQASDPNIGFYSFQKYQQFRVGLPNLQVVKYTLILSAKKLFLYCGRAKSSGGAVRSIGEKKFTIPP